MGNINCVTVPVCMVQRLFSGYPQLHKPSRERGLSEQPGYDVAKGRGYKGHA